MGRYNLIVVSSDIRQLSGNGEEHLLDQYDNVIAIFWDGNMPRQIKAADPDADTLTAEAA